MVVTESFIRVRYAETDQMGVVYHANFLVWMEIGRTDYCRMCGFRYAEMEQEAGARLAVTSVQCRYLAPARYDDDILIRTWVSDLRSRQVIFHYTIHQVNTQHLIAEGETIHTVTNQDGKLMRFPQKYFDLLSNG
jgi:acyl-CoA thioester hydrolase